MDQILKEITDLVTLYGLKIVGAIATLIIGIWISKWLAKLTGKLLKKRNVDETLTKFVVSLVKIALITFVIISAVDQIGVQTSSFVAVIGAAGLAVGFALQGSLSNFAAGVMLIIFKPIKVGDYVQAGGGEGVVESVGIFITTLVSVDNKTIFVPNSKLTGDNIVNFTAKDTRRVDLIFGISYEDDIDKARSAIKSVLDSHPKILKEPAADILVSELADSSVNFAVRPWTKSEHYWDVYFDVMENVKKKFDEMNIAIPFPQRDVHLFQNQQG